MDNDKPICGACEHWKRAISLIGVCMNTPILFAPRAWDSEPLNDRFFDVPDASYNCFKLWEEK